MQILWDEEKDTLLRETRWISFQEVEAYILSDTIVSMESHYNTETFPHQKMILINHKNYIYYIPCILKDDTLFLKTIIPSRKLTKKYLSS